MPTQTAAEYYREQAKLYFERATAAQNPDTRKGCEIMARQWLDLAKRAEKAHEEVLIWQDASVICGGLISPLLQRKIGLLKLFKAALRHFEN